MAEEMLRRSRQRPSMLNRAPEFNFSALPPSLAPSPPRSYSSRDSNNPGARSSSMPTTAVLQLLQMQQQCKPNSFRCSNNRRISTMRTNALRTKGATIAVRRARGSLRRR